MFHSVWTALSVQNASVNTLTTGRLLAVHMTLLLTARAQETEFCCVPKLNVYNLLYPDRY